MPLQPGRRAQPGPASTSVLCRARARRDPAPADELAPGPRPALAPPFARPRAPADRQGKAEQQAKKDKAAEEKALAAARVAAAAEAAEWDDGAKKPSAKKADEEAKKAAKAARKAEADEELEAEIAAASKPGKVTGNKAVSKAPKLTAAQIAANLEADQKAAESAAAKESKGVVNEYMGKLTENSNSLDAIDASTPDDALAALDAANDTSVDKLKLRAAFEAFQEGELPRLREEKPGLKLQQYKEIIWKAWQKSPQNPLRQRA